jgi:hypothetical protein
MPVIPINRVVDKERVIGKMEGLGGGEAQGAADKIPKSVLNIQKRRSISFRPLRLGPNVRPSVLLKCRVCSPRGRTKGSRYVHP